MSNKEKKFFSINTMIKIAILTAISAIVMLFEFPLPFAPGFYELDLSEAIILMGGFAMGPAAAVVIEFLKNVLNIFMNGAITAYVGELANFVMGCAFVVPACFFYKYHKSIKGAILSLIIGTASLTVVSCFVNYFIMIPAYVHLAHFPMDAIISMGSEVNPLVGSLESLIVFAVVPFNLVKGVICSVINLLLYKRLSKILHI